jgi:hypothetical protein
MHGWLMAGALVLGAGCAGLLGVEELPGVDGGGDGGGVVTFEVQVTVLRDGVAANGIDIVGHGSAGEVADQAITVGGVASVEIPAGGMVSALVDLEPARFAVRTWTDLEDGEELALEIGSGSVPLTEATIQFNTSPPGTPDRFEYMFRCGGPSSSGAISVPASDTQSLNRACLGADGTLDIVARVGEGETITGIASVGGIAAGGTNEEGPEDGGTFIAMPAWRGAMELGAMTVETDEDASELQVGEYRNGSFFPTSIGPSGGVLGDAAVIRFDPSFAELVAIAVGGGSDGFPGGQGGGDALTIFADPSAPSVGIDAALLDIDDLATVETAREPRPAVDWTLSDDSVELDGVLFSIQLFDVASPAKTLTWHVVSPPGRGRVEMPEFPDGLSAQPGEFQGWSSGTAAAVASSELSGYRALRARGGLTGPMAVEPPIQEGPGTVRIHRESLVPP